VGCNNQAGIATIITKDKLAQISLNEIDIVNVKLGQNVDLSFDAIPGEKFEGTVAQIDTVGVSTSNVVSFAVKISIPNADERIKSGMSVTAEIIIEGKENVLTVPSGTIKTEKDVSYVLRKVGNDEASKDVSDKRSERANERVEVEVGMTNDIDTEIISGLQEGERVVSKTNNGGVSTTRQTGNIFSIMGGNNNRGFGGAGSGQRTGGNNVR
jgi:HlyD family secretion protein